jgi:hypothetical protein
LIPLQNLSAADLYRIEFATNFGSTNNLLDNSSALYDAYNTSTVKLSLYPLSSLELSMGGQNLYYRDLTGLSTITGQTGFIFIPTPRTAKFSIYTSGNFSVVRYHSQFEEFNTNTGDILAAVGYKITPELALRAGLSFSSTTYIDPKMEDKDDIEYFLGGNITFPGEIGFDIETGFARANYSNLFMDADTSDIFVGIAKPDTMPRLGSSLQVIYISPRLSRMIAPKTGLSILFTKRNFQNYDSEVIAGFSTGYLSPWASVWEGQSIVANIKSFLIPKLIFTAGAGYWDKTYMKALEEYHRFYIQIVQDQYNRRQDWQTKYYFSLQWPIASHSGLYLEPSVRFDYARSISTEDLYNYSDYTYSAMINVRF